MSKQFLVSIDLVQNQLENAVLQNLTTANAPATPLAGQVFYDTTLGCAVVYNGSAWIPADVAKVSAGYIALSKLATDPLARANHTGTQEASTISDLATVVKAYRLDEFAVPTASVSMNSQKITNLGAPTAGSNDAARIVDVENAVQSAAAGIDSKASVRVVATSNITLSGTQTIDDIAVAAGNRVLVTGQTDPIENGVYIVAAGAWSRALDGDLYPEISAGAFWFVEEGTSKGATQYRCSNTGTFVIGTDPITIVQFGASAMYTASNGVQLVGNDFSAALASNSGLNATGGLKIDPTVALGAANTYVARKMGFDVGDGSATSYTLTHNFNSRDVAVSVHRASGSYDEVEVTVEKTSTSAVTLKFGSAPASNAFRAVVVG